MMCFWARLHFAPKPFTNAIKCAIIVFGYKIRPLRAVRTAVCAGNGAHTEESKMRCLYCNCTESKVIDSRSADDDRTIRRRRECMGCGRRFTTYETIEVAPILVVKSDGTRQAFDLGKIKRGVIKACEKRPVPIEKIDALADDITKKLYNSMAQEVSSKQIGEMVMEGLKELDEVAYVRYASVYRSFKDISSFMRELQQMMEYKAEEEQKGERRAEKN